MATLQISDGLMKRLQQIAQREKQSIEAIIQNLITIYDLGEVDAPQGTLARLAQEALKTGLSSEPVDTSERSREILNTEYPEHVQSRPQDSENDG